MINIPIIVPKNVEIVVASFGGVGTTFLMNYIAKYKNTNFSCDRDLIKHSPIPPISYNKHIRFLYIYGDPILATISLFRRGYHLWQSEKLTRYNHNYSAISQATTLEKYASSKIDRFKFETHFHNWYETYLVHPTMFIRYESIFDNIEPLIDFLELPKIAIHDFPKKKKRKSLSIEVSDEILRNLQEIYGSFSDELKSLKDIELRIPPQNRSLTKTYLSYPYPQVIVNNLLDFKLMARNNLFATYKKLKTIKFSLFPKSRTN